MPRNCELCGLSFDAAASLHDHMKQHMEDFRVEERLFECDNCCRSFFSNDDIDRHNERVHAPY